MLRVNGDAGARLFNRNGHALAILVIHEPGPSRTAAVNNKLSEYHQDIENRGLFELFTGCSPQQSSA